MKATRLGDLCDIQSGGTPRREERRFYGGQIPWAKIGDLESADGLVASTAESLTNEGLAAIRGRLFPPGTVLLAMYGSVGKVAVAGTAMATNQAILGIKVRKPELLSPQYLRRWLEQIQSKLVFDARGVTQQNISATLVRDLRIPLPPLAEQRQTAQVLDKADAIRRKRRESLRLLDEFLRSAFLEMFGDPVRNEKGWEVVRLEAVSGIVSGVTKGRKLRDASRVTVPYLRVANVQDGRVDLTEVKTIEATADELAQYELRSGDILLTEGGDPDKLGRGAVWRGEIEGCIHQNHVFRVRLKNDGFVPDYVSALLGSAYGKRYFLKAAKQTTGIASINRTQLGGFPVLAAPPDRQEQYAAVALKVREVEARLLEAAKATENLFDSLAQRAFSAGASGLLSD